MPPLGLLAVGGPLIDAGHDVRLIDAEIGPLPLHEIVSAAKSWSPDAVLIGHSGSTSAHPAIVEITRALKAALPIRSMRCTSRRTAGHRSIGKAPTAA